MFLYPWQVVRAEEHKGGQDILVTRYLHVTDFVILFEYMLDDNMTTYKQETIIAIQK